jgi:hypothetical protein
MIKPLVQIDTETGETKWLDKPPPDCAFIVVMPLSDPLIMPDNLTGNCAGCTQAVQFRPDIPAGFPVVCAPCAMQWAVESGTVQ